MIYIAPIIIISLILLAAAYLGQPVKRAVVQPVKGGKLLDAVLTEKSRWQVWWDEHKAAACFVAGLLGLMVGAGL